MIMATIKISKEQKQLIEKLGVLHEKRGYPPAASRILALLLVSNETELSFEEIQKVLNLSKSATSNALNMLLNTEEVEYITKPGDRKRYFRNNLIKWESKMKQVMEGMSHFAQILQDVLKQRPGDTVEFNAKLKKVINFIEFLGEEMKETYSKWEAKNR